MASSILDRIAEIMEVPKDDHEELVGEIQALLGCLDDLNLAKQLLAQERDTARAAAAEAERLQDIYKKGCDTLRVGICGVLNTTKEFYGYTDWDKDLVEHLEEFVAEKDRCLGEAAAFADGIVEALGLPPAVYTEEQLITAVRDLKPVQSIMDAALVTRHTEPLHDEIAALRSIIFAHESREILLKADLKRANEALAAAGVRAPEMASTNSRVPTLEGGRLVF